MSTTRYVICAKPDQDLTAPLNPQPRHTHTRTQTPNGRPYADYQEELGAVRSRPGWSKEWRRIRAEYGFPPAPDLFAAAATISPQSTRLAATTASSPQLAPSTPVRSPPPSPPRRHRDHHHESGRRRLLLDLTGEDADDEGTGAAPASTEEEEEQYDEEEEGDHDILSHIRRRPHPASPSPPFSTPTPKPRPPLLASYRHQGRHRRRRQQPPQMGEVLNFSEVRGWPIALLVLGLPLALLLVLRAPLAELGRAVWANMTMQRSA